MRKKMYTPYKQEISKIMEEMKLESDLYCGQGDTSVKVKAVPAVNHTSNSKKIHENNNTDIDLYIKNKLDFMKVFPKFIIPVILITVVGLSYGYHKANVDGDKNYINAETDMANSYPEDTIITFPAVYLPAMFDETVTETSTVVSDETITETSPAVSCETIIETSPAVSDETIIETSPAVFDETVTEISPAVSDETVTEISTIVSSERLGISADIYNNNNIEKKYNWFDEYTHKECKIENVKCDVVKLTFSNNKIYTLFENKYYISFIEYKNNENNVWYIKSDNDESDNHIGEGAFKKYDKKVTINGEDKNATLYELKAKGEHEETEYLLIFEIRDDVTYIRDDVAYNGWYYVYKMY